MKNVFSPKTLGIFFTNDKLEKTGIFTVVSKKTGKDYTYKIISNFFNNKQYIHVYIEKGYLDFVRLGTYFQGKIFKNKEIVLTDSAKGIAWILQKVETNDFEILQQSAEFLHLGKCLRCNRPLTDADSIADGLGKICKNK